VRLCVYVSVREKEKEKEKGREREGGRGEYVRKRIEKCGNVEDR
jgi:hypothetical protein